MKTHLVSRTGPAPCPGPGRQAAFTMVEVAIALGVIAIALVAILGVLPQGLKVQQQNREDTLLNQDGRLLVELIRSGRDAVDPAQPLKNMLPDWPNSVDYLTNHVLAIVVTNIANGATLYVNPWLVSAGQPVLPFGRMQGRPDRELRILTNGLHMVGLLSRPKLESRPGGVMTNYIAALVRSISGPASDQGSVGRELALTYIATSEVSPLGNYPRRWIDFQAPGLTPEEVLVRSNRFMMALNQGGNFNELRLSLAGPAYEGTRNGQRRWITYRDATLFRTALSGRLYSYQVLNDPQFVVSFLLEDGYQRVTP